MTKRTKEDEPKTERFNMFLSPLESQAIDDWAWQNRVRSKSEAVRRLIAIGIALDSQTEKLASQLDQMWKVREIGHNSIASELEGDPDWEKVAAKAIGTLAEMIEPQSVLSEKLFAILHQIALLKSAPDLRDALLAAEKSKIDSEERLRAMQAAFATAEGEGR